MKRTSLVLLMSLTILALAGCGGDGSSGPPPPPPIVAQILSNPVYDGDISQDSIGTLTVTQGTAQTYFAGIDPATGTEYRAFLDFPLTGANGVPGNASIVSATLDIVVNDVILQSSLDTLPIRIELVSIPLPPTLIPSDFDRNSLLPIPPFTTIVPPISSADIGLHVAVDVTPLMVQAQSLGLSDFQVRILEDLVAAPPGLMVINDTTDPALRGNLAPLLEVKYF